jgi:hypothetical protein
VRFRIRRFMKPARSAAEHPAAKPVPCGRTKTSGRRRACAMHRRSTTDHVRWWPTATPALHPARPASDSAPVCDCVSIATTAADFWRSFPTPLNLSSYQISPACRIYAAAFRARTGVHRDLPAEPAAPPLSASCSSGQRFAFSSSRFHLAMDTVAVRLTLPLAGRVEDFHRQVSAPCRAHKYKSRQAGGSKLAID